MFLTSRKEFGKHKLLAGSTTVKTITPADLSRDGVRPVPSSSEKSHSFKTIAIVGASLFIRENPSSLPSLRAVNNLLSPWSWECLKLMGYVLLSMKHGKNSALDAARLVGLNGLCTKLLLRFSVSKRSWNAYCLAEIFSINIRLSLVAL